METLLQSNSTYLRIDCLYMYAHKVFRGRNIASLKNIVDRLRIRHLVPEVDDFPEEAALVWDQPVENLFIHKIPNDILNFHLLENEHLRKVYMPRDDYALVGRVVDLCQNSEAVQKLDVNWRHLFTELGDDSLGFRLELPKTLELEGVQKGKKRTLAVRTY